MKLIATLSGVIPFFIGIIMAKTITKFSDIVLPYFGIGVLTLIIWAYISYKITKHNKNIKETVIFMNILPLIYLLVIMGQLLINKAYFSNAFGVISQYYYLPTINFSSKIVGVFLTNIGVLSSEICSFILFLLTSYLGSKKALK